MGAKALGVSLPGSKPMSDDSFIGSALRRAMAAGAAAKAVKRMPGDTAPIATPATQSADVKAANGAATRIRKRASSVLGGGY